MSDPDDTADLDDREQPAEDLDEERLHDDFPPEEPLAADDRGITGVEELGGESMAEREERREPETWERRPEEDSPGSATVVEEVGEPAGPVTKEGTMPVEEETPTDPLPPDDELTGDETTRDVAPERDPEPAEEAAVHPEDETGSS